LQFINTFLTGLLARVQTLRDEREEGQTLVEYALIIALVSVVLVVALEALAGGIGAVFSDIQTELTNASS
jgi:pilus assembly protein Flp/PilA